MRTTPAFEYSRFLESLRTIRERIAVSEGRAASGKRVEKPSDDPAAAGEALGLRARIATLERFANNASVVQGFVSVTDSTLSALGDLLNSARSEAIRGASGTTTPEAREAIAKEIDSIREQTLGLARTRFQGRYIFSGTDTQTNPYDDSGNYLGNTGAIRVETGDGETTAANIAGSAVFGSGTGVVGILEGLSIALRAGDTAGIQAAADSIEAARRQVSDARTVAGERILRLNAAGSRTADARVTLLSRLNDIESADLAETITKLAQDQIAEQLVLQTGARIGRKSLFDFIG